MRLPTITGPTTATEAARLTAEAAVVIHATLPVALERMTAAAGTGYPSTASGADAGGRGSGPVASSTERHALNESTKADKASAALQRVYSGLGELAALSDEIARIVGPFFEGRLSVGEMEYIRRSVGKDVFCANPAHTTGVNRLPDRLHCRFCDDVRRNTGMLPDRKLLEIKATGTVRPENYDAFRARHRQTKVAKKGKGKAVAA